MQIRFHRLVQKDLQEILTQYSDISKQLADEFFTELQVSLQKRDIPTGCHFDASGLRRRNFNRFPYHFLYDIRKDHIRVWTVRHDRRHPAFGLRRF